MTRLAVNGIEFHVEESGRGEPLLLLHGFTGSAATWRNIAPAWDGWRTLAVDLIGHGDSDAPPDEHRYTMESCVADLVALLDALGIGRACVLGYSMGGRVALHLAAAVPERVSALVLEGASPGIDDAAERDARVSADRAMADGIERDGVPAFIDRWEQVPLFASQERLPDDVRARLRAQRLRNRAEGLANSLRGMGAGVQQPLWSRLGALTMPSLLIAGGDDAKYREMAHATAGRMPSAQVCIVPGAGHAVHLEQPAAFSERVKEFLATCLRNSERREPSPRP